MTPDLRVAYLIAGSDWPKVDAAISRLRAHFPEESVEQFSAGGDGPSTSPARATPLASSAGAGLSS